MTTLPPCLQGSPPHSCPGVDLSGADLSGLDLTNAVLTNTTLTGTTFAGVTSMAGADLTGATMGDGTDFSGCDLTTTTFGAHPALGSNPDEPTSFAKATVPYAVLGSTWSALDLAEATIAGMPDEIDFLSVTRCDVSGVDFSGKTLNNAHFATAVCQRTKFGHATLKNVVFGRETLTPTDLSGASFAGATISTCVFDTATLTNADFRGAPSMASSTFLNARMDGTVFDGTDLTTCEFSASPRWSQSPGNNTSFRNATLNYETLLRQWSYLDLTGATLVGLDQRVDLSWLLAEYAVLTGWKLDGYMLNNANFTGATIAGATFVGCPMAEAVFQGAQGAQPRFDGATLTDARFNPITDDTGAVQQTTELHGASFRGAHLANADFASADFGPDGTGSSAVVSTFQGAGMQGLRAAGVDLTRAQLTGGIIMHGANFSGATLTSANMTGVALGSLTNVFTVGKESDPAGYTSFLTALEGAQVDVVVQIFAAPPHDITLPPATTTITPIAPGSAWAVKDSTADFTVLLVTASDGTQSLQVFQPATESRGVLSGAFMPDAILNDANLIDVDASGIQLFTISSSKQLAGSILYGIELSDAILGSDVPIDVTQANLFHASLTNTFLANASLRAANLTGASLDGAQLQGADFTDATLTGTVVMRNAAVSTHLQKDETGDVYGVYLFSVPDGSTDRADYTAAVAELNGSKHFVIATEGDGDYGQFISSLNAGELGGVRAAFAANRVDLSAGATPHIVDRNPHQVGVAWQIDDPSPPPGQASAYTVWEGFGLLGDKQLLARPSVPELRKLFLSQYQVDLRWQATVTLTAPEHGGTAWLIDNDSLSTDNLSLGYVKVLVQEQQDQLDFFGIELRATRMARAGQLEARTITFASTVLCKDPPCEPTGKDTFLTPTTICPNGQSLATNQSVPIPWDQMLRAQTRPPHPPECVPSPVAPCTQL